MIPNLSILICTYQAATSLDLLFDSLERQDWCAGDEVILVYYQMESERLFHVQQRIDIFRKKGIVCHILLVSELGLHAARAQGFKLATALGIFTLDDDNTLSPNALNQIRKCWELNPALGGICPKIEPVWEVTPPAWVIILGHDVLSYNSSTLRSAPEQFCMWAAKKVGMRPPGGGMIIHRKAVQHFLALVECNTCINALGRKKLLTEDHLLFQQIYQLKMPTAYDPTIQVFHHIPKARMSFSYLSKLLSNNNFCYALIALILYGKWLAPLSVAHCLLRLSARWVTGLKNTRSPYLILAQGSAFLAYLRGTIYGVFYPESLKLKQPLS